MPVYEFSCEECGPFEMWLEMKDVVKPIICSTCKAVAERVFSVPGIIVTPYALRRRIERGREPRVIRRPHRDKSVQKQIHDKQQSKGRPWMIGH